jgi:hypothetical protein
MKFIENIVCLGIQHFGSPDGVPTVIAIIAVLITILLLYKTKVQNQRALINSVFEEIRHNLNMTDKLHPPIDNDTIIFILKELRNINKDCYYPNPTDGADTAERLLSPYKHTINENFNETSYFMILRQDTIVNALSSGQILNLAKERLFLNLGHALYSIRRYNSIVEIANSDIKQSKNHGTPMEGDRWKIKHEYFYWLHFRLLFLMIDMSVTVKSCLFADKKFIKKIKNLEKNLLRE